MSERPWAILQISTRDVGGGAEKVAWDLFRTYRAMGHSSHLAVGYKRTKDAGVLKIPQGRGEPTVRRIAWNVFQRLQPWYGRVPGVKWLCRKSHDVAAPRRTGDLPRGIEDFHYPGSASVDDLGPVRPDLIHTHNLHGSYFDLRSLAPLSGRCPTVLTLHDAWLLTGHCAHSFDCDRWKTGCGSCPDLTIYPSVLKDATAHNWERKRDIFAQSRVHVATPCRWLMDRVQSSMLAPAIISSRVIPYGIDLGVFHPGDRRAARERLGLDPNAHMLLFAAQGIRRNSFKDYDTMRAAVGRIAERQKDRSVAFIALGERAHEERIGDAVVRFVPFERDPKRVALFFQAADVYLHAARVDTFPNAVLEGLACGCCVVATAVGGIGEQVRALDAGAGASGITRHDAVDATGVLVAKGDAAGMAAAVDTVLSDDVLRLKLQTNAATDARRRFDLKRHARDYLNWYGEILGQVRTGDRHRPAAAVAAEMASPG